MKEIWVQLWVQLPTPNFSPSKTAHKTRKHSVTLTITECFLAGALGLEPRAYGFGDRRSTN